MNRTLVVKTDLNPEDFFPLMKDCSEIFNAHVDWALKNKSYSKVNAHKDLYHNLHKQYPLVPASFIQTVRDQALEAIKTVKFKRYPRKKEQSGIRYDKRLIALRNNQITLSCIGKRKKITISIPEYFKQIFTTWKFASATLTYRKNQHCLYLNLTFKTDNPELLPITLSSVQGIDRGLYNLAVTSDGQILSSNKVRAHQRRFLFNKRHLQAKGTRSAKRRLVKLSGKEKRFSREVNHIVTKQLVNQKDVTTFVLEDLSRIRNKRRGKKLNKHLSSWPFYQFEQFLTYKAQALGKQVVYVDPRYTSQCCSQCGCINRINRHKSRFHCTQCGYTNHADINAAINIRDRRLSVLYESTTIEQVLVNAPIVSGLS